MSVAVDECRVTAPSEPPPVFIVGCPRSGTTLVAGLFANTPWGVPFETHFIPKYARKLGGLSSLADEAVFSQVVGGILRERPMRQRRIQVDVRELYRLMSDYDYARIVDAICRKAACSGARSWADKTPQYVLHLPLIHKLFPESKVVCMVRDGRDVALSLMRKAWGPANIYACARYWRRCHAAQPILDRLSENGQLLVVRYEDVLREPRVVGERLLAFVGVADGHRLADAWAARVRSDNSGKWQELLTPADVRLFERVAGSVLRRFGYACGEEEAPLHWLQRSAYHVHDRAKHWVHLVRMNTIEAAQIRLLGKEPFAE